MAIVDANGRPINTSVLDDEIARASITSIRNVFHESIARGLTPAKLGALLTQVDEEGDPRDYLTLAEEMEERDPNYRSKLSIRKMATQALPIQVAAADPDDARSVEIQEFVQSELDNEQSGIVDAIGHLLDAIGKGYSVVEIMWQRDSDRWFPLSYEWRDPRFFRYDRNRGDELMLLTEEEPAEGVPLEPAKFMLHEPAMKSGLQIRGGLARVIAALHLYKSFALRDWMVFAELFGMPIRLGKYDTVANNPADIATLRTAVGNIGTDAAAVIPKSMMIEFIEAARSGDGKGLFEVLATWLDKQTTLAVLGTNATSEEGGSFAKARALEEIRDDILKSDARQISTTINRDLVRPLVDLNFGPQPRGMYPTAALLVEDDEDLVAFANAITPFIDRGLEVEQAPVRDKFKLQEPAEGASILKPKGGGGGFGGGTPEPEPPGPEPEPDAAALIDGGAVA